MRSFSRSFSIVSLCALAWACSSSPSTPPPSSDGGTGPKITISGFAYSPTDLSVAPGTTITVVNQDSMAHSVTSESADGAFDSAGVNGVTFDTGDIAGGTTTTLTIPSSAPVGTVIPFFCTVHRGQMATPNGHITIVAASSGSTRPAPAAAP